jgi:hypothetical protein
VGVVLCTTSTEVGLHVKISYNICSNQACSKARKGKRLSNTNTFLIQDNFTKIHAISTLSA